MTKIKWSTEFGTVAFFDEAVRTTVVVVDRDESSPPDVETGVGEVEHGFARVYDNWHRVSRVDGGDWQPQWSDRSQGYVVIEDADMIAKLNDNAGLTPT